MGCAQELETEVSFYTGHSTRALTVSLRVGVEQMFREDGKKQDHLGDDAAATGASTTGINGSRGGGLMLGSVRDDGEERSEGIHCCVLGG